MHVPHLKNQYYKPLCRTAEKYRKSNDLITMRFPILSLFRYPFLNYLSHAAREDWQVCIQCKAPLLGKDVSHAGAQRPDH